ncbi:MAG: DUF1566 domain-containing protein [Haliea sp.]|jgi:hypothetical protein|nr:DUF1566 domain-containing protein [Haliea sp.]
MKNRPKTALISVPLLLFLASCSQDDGGKAASAQGKYSRITNSEEVCIQDSETGLVWATKTDRGGLHDFRNTYSWWDPNEANGELDYRGTENAGKCAGSSCDTWNYVIAVNQAGYCGYTDWRMPSKDELFSISELQRADNPPTIDITFFPHSQAAEYWSRNDYSFQWDAAWAWNFQFGHDRVDWKKAPKFVRLVRGSGQNLPEVKD